MAKMNKRGIFFTFVSIMIVALLVLGFSGQSFITNRDRVPVENARIQVADTYVKNLKFVYLDRAVATSSLVAMRSLLQHVNSTGYLSSENELNTVFEELLINGSIGGTPVAEMQSIDITHRLDAIENLSEEHMLISTTFNNSDFNLVVYQDNTTGPLIIGINTTYELFVDAGPVSYKTVYNSTVFIDITGMDDPLYLVEKLDNAHTNHIALSNITRWNISSTGWFIGNHTYRYNGQAPSYLQRFYDDLSASECCGIESMINPVEYGYGDNEQPKSYVDWCFYSNRCAPDAPGTYWNVSGITAFTTDDNFYGFKLDDAHLEYYNVSDFACRDVC